MEYLKDCIADLDDCYALHPGLCLAAGALAMLIDKQLEDMDTRGMKMVAFEVPEFGSVSLCMQSPAPESRRLTMEASDRCDVNIRVCDDGGVEQHDVRFDEIDGWVSWAVQGSAKPSTTESTL